MRTRIHWEEVQQIVDLVCCFLVCAALKTFGIKYTKAFGVALVDKIAQDALDAKDNGDDEMQLKSIPPPTPPKKEGPMKKQRWGGGVLFFVMLGDVLNGSICLVLLLRCSLPWVDCSSIMKRWKQKHFWIDDEWQLAFSASADKKENPDIINLWGYKVKGIQFKPEGPRKGGPEWIPDEERPNCSKCDKAFSTLVWHHHCRNCGEVFCSDCAGNKLDLNHFGYDKPQRVCDDCFEKAGGGRSRAKTFAVTDDDAKEDAEFHGIQLLHVKRTPYVLQCETLAEKKEWMEVLKECCKAAGPPINPDPVMAAAFEAAHKAASWEAGMWGWWRITGDEAEMLADVISHVVYRTVISPAIDGADPNIPIKIKRMATSAINKQVTTLIRAAVGPAWKALTDQVKNNREKIEEKLKPLLDQINKAKQDLLAKMQEGIMKIVDPLMEKIGTVVLGKVMPVITEPIMRGFQDTFTVLDEQIKELAKDVDSKEKLEKLCHEKRRQLHYWWGPMRDINDGLDDFRRNVSDLIQGSDALSHISVSSVMRTVQDSIFLLIDNTLYTLQEEAEPSADGVAAAWKSVSAKLLHDSQVTLLKTYADILNMALVAPIQEKVLQSDALKGIMDPLDAMVPDAIQDFISPSGLLEELLGNVCDAAVDKAVESSSEKPKKNLTQRMTALAI